MKRRVLTALAVLLFLTLLSLLAAYNLNCILSGRLSACTPNPLAALSGLSDRRVRLLFFLLTALCALFVLYMLFENSYVKYKSEMLQVTPDIETPKAEGQGQYGTARWMPPDHIEAAFTVVAVDARSPLLRSLAAQGRADLKEDAP